MSAAHAVPALSYADALQSVLQRDVLGVPERVAVADAGGRALAEPVVSAVSLPPWNNAGMDGYAVQRADVQGATASSPVTLTVQGSIAAGADPDALPTLLPGHAIRIMTGAPVPRGADAVIRIEDTDRGSTRVTFTESRDLAGRANIRPRGEEVSAGSEVFGVGTTLTASHLGVLASVGCAEPVVYRRPRVTVLSGGDELVMLDRFSEVAAGNRIVSSTSYALPALLSESGADVRVVPLVPDTLRAMTEAIGGALDAGCDLLVTTGGVSVGAHDYTRDALEALGGAIGFWRAKIRPGGPIGTGTVRGVPWLGLPGNPVSSMVTGLLFACPLVRRLGGHSTHEHRSIPVRMMDSVDTAAPLTHFLRVVLRTGADGMLEARMAGPQGSNLLRTLSVADALIQIPEHAEQAEAGATYRAILLPGATWT